MRIKLSKKNRVSVSTPAGTETF